jgi:hypothetical protein
MVGRAKARARKPLEDIIDQGYYMLALMVWVLNAALRMATIRISIATLVARQRAKDK